MNNNLSKETVAQMRFETEKKSIAISYLLWLFLGGFGAHRFYLRSRRAGLAFLICGLLLWPTMSFISIGGMGLGDMQPSAPFLIYAAISFIYAVFVFAEAIIIPGMVRRLNNELIRSLE